MSEIQYGPLTLSGEDEYTVTACQRDAVRVELPGTVDGIPVLRIGECAFADCDKLREVIFAEGGDITDDPWIDFRIEANAFMNCSALKEIELPYYVQSIGHGAFYGCTGLKRADFPTYCSMSDYVFAGCKSLREVPLLTSVTEGMFSGCASLTALPLSDKASTVETDAFEHCYGLTAVVIPATVTRIGSEAFSNCRNLKSVRFANPVGWYCKSFRSLDGGPRDYLELSDPIANARRLVSMDFDDGVIAWCRDK